jgi:uncharacterized protein YjeT (DUF2065 family)
MGQYLTAVFKLRPTRRKAAVLQRTQRLAEGVFWDLMEAAKERAQELANTPDKKVRASGLSALVCGLPGYIVGPAKRPQAAWTLSW